MIEDDALLLVELLSRGGEQLVDLGIAVARGVAAGDLLDALADVEGLGADRRIGARGIGPHRQVEVPVAERRIAPGRGVHAHDLEVDADLGEVGAHQPRHVVQRSLGLREADAQRKAVPGGAAREARLVQHLLGTRGVVGIGAAVGGVEDRLFRRDRSGRYLAEAEARLGQHLVAVHRIEQRLSDFLLVQRRVARVDEDHVLAGDLALGDRDLHFRIASQPLHLGQRHRIIGNEVDIALLERECPRGLVGNDLEHQPVEIRAVLKVELRVAHEGDVAALAVFLEHERAGAHRLEICRILPRVLPGVEDVLGDDRRTVEIGEAAQQRRIGIFELEDGGVLVGRRHRFDGLEQAGSRPVVLAVDVPQSPGHVFRGERPAVMPGDVLEEAERVGQAVGRDLPLLREIGLHVAVVVETDDCAVDLSAHVARRDIGRDRRVDDLDVARQGDDHGAALLAGLGMRLAGQGRRCTGAHGGKAEHRKDLASRGGQAVRCHRHLLGWGGGTRHLRRPRRASS